MAVCGGRALKAGGCAAERVGEAGVLQTFPDGRCRIDREEVLRQERRCGQLRRAQDIALSSLALVALCVPMLIVALVVWLEKPGASPIFTQIRVGRNGRHFRFRKFRSMVPNAEEGLEGLLSQNEMSGPVFKMKDDPRITRVGRFLRKTGIDELPQL
ncbi:MAG: sugar transferase, partial [Eubacteriales bacterium]|nr:sugar transferase [Eubacteriales bacterium]